MDLHTVMGGGRAPGSCGGSVEVSGQRDAGWIVTLSVVSVNVWVVTLDCGVAVRVGFRILR